MVISETEKVCDEDRALAWCAACILSANFK